MAALTVYVANDHDHEMQDRPCAGPDCGEPLGQGRYVYGDNRVDVYHLDCWADAIQATPQTEVPDGDPFEHYGIPASW